MPAFLVILFAALIGTLSGAIYRRLHYRKLAKATLRKPAYDLTHTLSPSEFSLIVTGRLTRGAAAAEVILLEMSGYLILSRRGAFVMAQRTGKFLDGGLTPLQRQVLQEVTAHALPGEPAPLSSASLSNTLSYNSQKSLLEKGWINPAKPYLVGFSPMPTRYWTILAVSLVLGTFGTMLVAVTAFGTTVSDSIFFGLFVDLIIIILAVIWGLWIVFSGNFRDAAGAAIRTSDKYKTDYDAVYGVYEYMRVSGMDTMTPEYDSLDFKGLDPLYPYAVAVGLDKRIINELQVWG